MKKVLVTGGAGMIGTNLVKKLLQDNNTQVIVIDNFFSSGKNNTEQFISDARYTLIERDVQTPFDDIEDVDEIYHLAAPASPIYYQKDAVYTIRTIVNGTINALECARKNKSKILFASTSEIYGQPLEHPQHESYWGNVHTTGIRSCYDEGKRCGETLCADYARQYGIDTKIVRIFNTYGPYMATKDGRVIGEFITRMMKKRPIYVNGDGNQTRSFCFVSDMIDGLMRMMNSSEKGPINIGNPHESTINELVACISNVTGLDTIIEFKPMPEDDPYRRCPDISEAAEKLGWKPIISLDEGIKMTYDYFVGVLP